MKFGNLGKEEEITRSNSREVCKLKEIIKGNL